MFIDEVRARREAVTVEATDNPAIPSMAHGQTAGKYQENKHLHPSYMEWFHHNEDAYFR